MTPVIDQDPWRRQCDALDDLSSFIDEHAPGKRHSLPLLHWYVGPAHTVRAEIHAFDIEHGGGHRDPRTVITAYAKALDTCVEEHLHVDEVLLVVRGRIGPPEGTGEARRTHMVVSAKVPTENRRKVGGRAFLP
jgi:hypothetical protein